MKIIFSEDVRHIDTSLNLLKIQKNSYLHYIEWLLRRTCVVSGWVRYSLKTNNLPPRYPKHLETVQTLKHKTCISQEVQWSSNTLMVSLSCSDSPAYHLIRPSSVTSTRDVCAKLFILKMSFLLGAHSSESC